MDQGFEAFRAETPSGNRAQSGKESPAPASPEKEHRENEGKKSYMEYKTSGGVLKYKEYQAVRDAAEKKTLLNPLWSELARSYVRPAHINLSDKMIRIFGILRDIEPNENQYQTLPAGDHALLAEAFRMSGDVDSLNRFTASLRT